MFGGGSEGNRLFADFQAKLLAGPPQYDPVEEHMHRVMRLTGCWTAALAVVDTVVLWLFDPIVAVTGTVLLTLGALAVALRLLRPRARSSAG